MINPQDYKLYDSLFVAQQWITLQLCLLTSRASTGLASAVMLQGHRHVCVLLGKKDVHIIWDNLISKCIYNVKQKVTQPLKSILISTQIECTFISVRLYLVYSIVFSFLPWYEIFYKLLNRLADILNRTDNNNVIPFLDAIYNSKVPVKSTSQTITAGPREEFHFECPDPQKLPSIPENVSNGGIKFRCCLEWRRSMSAFGDKQVLSYLMYIVAV